MSQADQDHFHKLASLLPTEGRWRWVAFLIAIPSLIGALSAIGTALIWAVSFSAGVKYAVQRTPVHDSILGRVVTAVQIVATEEAETRDSLQRHGYYFKPAP